MITPIREDLDVMVHLNEANSYFTELEQCRRYENNQCRACDEQRMHLSPWCPTHFPWAAQIAVQRPIQLITEGTKEP